MIAGASDIEHFAAQVANEAVKEIGSRRNMNSCRGECFWCLRRFPDIK